MENKITQGDVNTFSHLTKTLCRRRYGVPNNEARYNTILDRFGLNIAHITLTKMWDDTSLKFWQYRFDDVKTAFYMFSNAAAHVFNFCTIIFKSKHFSFSSLLWMGLQTSVFGSYLLHKIATEKKQKIPLKPKFRKNKQTTKRWFIVIWHRWWRIRKYIGRPLLK